MAWGVWLTPRKLSIAWSDLPVKHEGSRVPDSGLPEEAFGPARQVCSGLPDEAFGPAQQVCSGLPDEAFGPAREAVRAGPGKWTTIRARCDGEQDGNSELSTVRNDLPRQPLKARKPAPRGTEG